MPAGAARSSALLKKVSAKCAAILERCRRTSRRRSARAFMLCCYEVGSEVRQQFESQFAYAEDLFREVKESDPVREKYPLLFLNARAPGHGELPPKIFLDLVEANRRQLISAGVLRKNISASELCTSCHPELLFSYRAEKGITGRMMGVAGIRASSA